MFFKKRITEHEASHLFVWHLQQSVKSNWSATYASLQSAFGTQFALEDEGEATGHLWFAAIAQELESLPNLFSADQAERLRKMVLGLISEHGEEDGEYLVMEVESYSRAWTEAKNGWNPANLMTAIPSRLLHNWLGPRIREFSYRPAGGDDYMLNRNLLMHVSMILMDYTGFWKMISGKCKIIPVR